MNLNPKHRAEIESLVVIRRPDVVAAKVYIAGGHDRTKPGQTQNGVQAVADWLEKKRAQGWNSEFRLQGLSGPELASIAEWLTQRLVAAKAIWELIAAGVLLPAGSIKEYAADIKLKVGSAHYSKTSPETFDYGRIALPDKIRWPKPEESALVAADGDLFLDGLDGVELHPGVHVAMLEAHKCLQQELVLPCLAMVTLAAEGLWSELARALVAGLPGDKHLNKLRRMLDHRPSLAALSAEVNTVMVRPEPKARLKECGLHLAQLREALVWTDALRDARNVLHWHAESATVNTVEKAAVFLMSAVRHGRFLSLARSAMGGCEPNGEPS